MNPAEALSLHDRIRRRLEGRLLTAADVSVGAMVAVRT